MTESGMRFIEPKQPDDRIVAAEVDRVREAGGEVVKEPFEFPGGRRFHFADPTGNELAVWADR